MTYRPSVARIASAVLTLVVAAACTDVSRPPTAPAVPVDISAARSLAPDGMEILSRAVIHSTVEGAQRARASRLRPHRTNNLVYQGGVGGIGVETAPKVYVVYWGSQWSNDPSGEAGIVQNFLSSVFGSGWLNSVTQYCQGLSSGTVFCNGAGTPAGNANGTFAGVWTDNGSAAPSQPTQSQLAAEAVKAAAHFNNTSASSNASAQYIIATAHGYNSSGFGTQYCAYHSSTSSSYGNVAYTNLPYITDAGSSCGANFNGLGPNAGITIVGGHELAETITDQFPNGGWLDSSGSENGDKCAWITTGNSGASTYVAMPNGSTFPVQSLWSNASSGCVLTY